MMNQYIMTSLCKVWIHLPLSSLKKSPPPPIFFSAKKKDKLFVFRWKDLQISGDFGFKCFFTASLPKSWTSFEPHKGLAVREDMLSNDQEKTKTDGWKNRQQSPFRYNMLDNHPSAQNHLFLNGFCWGFSVDPESAAGQYFRSWYPTFFLKQ